jgi:hypothetical protein
MPSPSIWPRAEIMAQQRPYSKTLDERRLATRLRPSAMTACQRLKPTQSKAALLEGPDKTDKLLGGLWVHRRAHVVEVGVKATPHR